MPALADNDNLLRSFDCTELTVKDIPLFLRASREMMISRALHPVSHVIPYDLYVNGTQRIPGDEFSSLQVMAAESLYIPGHSTVKTRRSGRNHPILDKLMLAVGKEKHRLWWKPCKSTEWIMSPAAIVWMTTFFTVTILRKKRSDIDTLNP